ncbi:MAG: GntG family PLP-dependent aldolase [Actinomycetota bacterium]
MADAEVGDAWYGDDPTVNALQERAAALVGTEAALYVPTGTMANQIALRLHVRGGGHLVVCAEGAHVASTEVMTSAVLSGISYRQIEGPDRGHLTAEAVADGLAEDSYYDVEIVDLVAVENTAGYAGGTCLQLDRLHAIREAVSARSLPLHLDGARLFNAAAATGIDPAEFGATVDTLMFCVSKGLGAPIGSLLCGPIEVMAEARRLQILFGGAWRQAGIMAAAGLLALERGPGRLHEDHERAQRLAHGVEAALPGTVDVAAVETNMVFADIARIGLDPLEVIDRLRDAGIGATPTNGVVRMVTHWDVDDDGIDVALEAWRAIASASRLATTSIRAEEA